METKTRVFVTLGVLVVLISGIYIFSDWFSKTTGYVLGEDQKAAFVTCLNQNASTLYETDDCAECEKQREILGERSYEIMNRVTCGADLCKGLKHVPAWEIEGKFYYGVKTFKELDELSSCAIT